MLAPDVCLIGPYPAPGTRHDGWTGVASYTANLAHALSAEGADVTVVAPREPGLPDRHDDGPIRVRRAFARGVRAVPDAARAAKATGAGVVHLQHETFLYGGPDHLPGLVRGLLALRRGRARSVVTMHHVVQPGTVDADFAALHHVRAPRTAVRAGLSGVSRAIRRLADTVIVHERTQADAVPGAAVVPHGVEVAAGLRDTATNGTLTALCFGFVAPYKGLETVLEAGDRAGESVEVVVAGGEHPRLAAQGASYGEALRAEYGDRVRFTGFVAGTDVPGLFADADVAVFPYPRPVATSGALALALAHGTPALVSPQLARTVGAPRPLVAPDDPDALAGRLRELHDDPSELRRVAAATRALGAGRSWAVVARRHLAIYGGAA